MTLDELETEVTPTMALIVAPRVHAEVVPYTSLYCRNSFHMRCLLASCFCACHRKPQSHEKAV
jgi:hypothetical protein